MKRNFHSDDEIPPAVWEHFPDAKAKLRLIGDLEDEIEAILSTKKRIPFAINSEPAIRTKVMRVYVRHQFIPATIFEKAHFIVLLEGQLLERSAASAIPFGSFFDKIRFHLDRRFQPSCFIYEWSADTNPEGVKGNCFRLKFYGDKPFPLKIFLHRAGHIRARFELSPQLREVLPFLPVDPTEEDVLMALLQYVQAKGLLDRRLIKCNKVRTLYSMLSMCIRLHCSKTIMNSSFTGPYSSLHRLISILLHPRLSIVHRNWLFCSRRRRCL
jgi:hypothetical protein